MTGLVSGPLGTQPGRVTIAPTGSCYDYMLFTLPTHRARTGSIWSRQTQKALGLIAINIFLQMTLTLVAGTYVLESVAAWKTNLVSSPEVIEYVQRRSVPLSDYLRKKAWGVYDYAWGGSDNETQQGEAVEEVKSKQLAPGEQLMPHCRARRGPSTPPGARRNLKKHAGFLEHTLQAGGPGGGGGGSGGGHGGGHGGKGVGSSMTDMLNPNEEMVYMPAPLCSEKDGMYQCLPPSVQIASYWEQLDWNGDGTWTVYEAEEDAAGISCLVQMWPQQVFKALSNFINSQWFSQVSWVQEQTWLPPEVKNHTAIPKPYFDMWLGLVGICIHSDEAMCGALVMKGLFDGALSPLTNNITGISDLQTAMDTCSTILAPGGLCDHALPQTYQLFRARHHAQCGEPHYMAGPIYGNPWRPDDSMYIALAVHTEVETFMEADTMQFVIFQYSVLMVFVIGLFSEVKELAKLIQLIIAFPDADPKDPEASLVCDEDTGTCTIKAITKRERALIATMVGFRLLIAVYIGLLGTAFLLADKDYLNLLLNAVALVFVLEIDELLFNAMASASTKRDIEMTEPIQFQSPFHVESRVRRIFNDWTAFGILVLLVVLMVLHHQYFTTKPILASLTCACQQEGEDCLDAFVFDKTWFDAYWLDTLPKAHDAIAAMKLKAMNAAKKAAAGAAAAVDF